MIDIVSHPIDVPTVLDSVRSQTSGGIVHFLGTIRNDGGIEGLLYESYPEMAKKVLEDIAAEAKRRWPVENVSVVHRVGWIPVGEEAVVVAVGSAHRAEAFDACRYVIDTLKHEAPIWKIEGEAPSGSAGGGGDASPYKGGRRVACC